MMQRVWAIFTAFYLCPAIGQACAVCYGDPGHPMSKGLNAGVLILLGVITVVLALFGALIFYFRKRLLTHKDD